MFDFFSKIVQRRTPQSNIDSIRMQAVLAVQEEQAQQKQTQIEADRQRFSLSLEAAGDDEQLNLALVLSCDFADGRFLAVQKIKRQHHLQELLPLMRKQDKRVAKWIQARLDEFEVSDRLQHAAQLCIAYADQLLTQDVLLTNQLVELDKQHRNIFPFPVEMEAAYQSKRQQLSARVELQTALQHELLELMREIDHAPALEVETELASEFELEKTKLATYDLRLKQSLAHTLAASIPRHLKQQIETKLQQRLSVFETATAQLKARSSEAYRTDLTEEKKSAAGIKNNAKKLEHNKSKLSAEQFEQNLLALEAAVDAGNVSEARRLEVDLKESHVRQLFADSAQQKDYVERLANTRAQLGRLISWAKWGSAVSREELVSTAENLASLRLGPKEIVETVGALRDQWKQMEAISGGVAKELWTRFDQACSTAYAPAALHFQQQAELRKSNLQQAQTWLHDFQIKRDQLFANERDWRAIHQALSQMQNQWRKLGAIDRKDKSKIEAQYEAVEQSLQLPLRERQNTEIEQRESLIAQVNALSSKEKSTVDQLRRLQEQWQRQAALLPLPRHIEQALWEKFRQACDAIFAGRKQALDAADAERQHNFELKSALCAGLESCEAQRFSELKLQLDQARQEWERIAFVPRAVEKELERRFAQAQRGLEAKMRAAEVAEKQAHYAKLERALQLYEALNQMQPNSRELDEIVQQWEALGSEVLKRIPALKSGFNQILAAKRKTDLPVHAASKDSKNADEFDQILLHLEILLGIDSPAVLAKERLQMQIEVLKDAFKNRHGKNLTQEETAKLLAMPQAFNALRRQRLAAILARSI